MLIINHDFWPIQVVASFVDEQGLHFLNIDQVNSIAHPDAQKVQDILKYCDGRTRVTEIADRAKQKLSYVNGVLTDLMTLGVVTDSRNQAQHFHRVSSYPTPFTRTLSDRQITAYSQPDCRRKPIHRGEVLEAQFKQQKQIKLAEQRYSCRHFSGQAIAADTLLAICHYAYSIANHVVPSGGGLYPLSLYVLVEKDQETGSNNVPSGYYYYDDTSDNLVRFKQADEQALKHCFNDVQTPFNTSVQIVIVGDLERQTYKYSNRGYRLTLLEAGHVAQNINLCCTELGLGSCELGGVLDEAMQAELDLPVNFCPLLAIAIGYPGDATTEPEPRPKSYRMLDTAAQSILKEHREIWLQNVGPVGGNCAFFGASAGYQLPDSAQCAGATATDYLTAQSKAIVEAYERWACSKIKVDFVGTEQQLAKAKKQFLSPNQLVPLSAKQAEACGTTPYQTHLPINWVTGKSIVWCSGRKTKHPILVPCDIAFYGHQDVQIYHGNSSGVAAYQSGAPHGSSMHALSELIERHAIMKTWYTHQAPWRCNNSSLPVHAQNRSKYWQKHGRQMSVLLSNEYDCTVIQVVITSEQYPFFVSGAAASIANSDLTNTLNKAIEEAEYGLMIALNNPNPGPIKASVVWTPSDHGQFYGANKKMAHRLSWLTSGPKVTWRRWLSMHPSHDAYEHYQKLSNELDVVEIDIVADRKWIRNHYLEVVRIISPHLIPINFGTNTAHYKHPALKGLTVHPDAKRLPHYFA